MLRKTLTIPLTVPRAVLYYIPFCPRPAMIVDQAALDKVNNTQVDGLLVEVKERLVKNMVNAFGKRLIQPHEHLWQGTAFRWLVYNASWCALLVNIPDLLMVAVTMQTFYALAVVITIDEHSAVTRAFTALCKE